MVWEFVLFYALIFFFAVTVGVVESVMARYRFLKVPQFLAGAFAVAVLSIVLTAIFGGEGAR